MASKEVDVPESVVAAPIEDKKDEPVVVEEKPRNDRKKLEPSALEASMMLLDAGVKSFEEAVHGIINAMKGKVRSMKEQEETAGGCDLFLFWK